MNKAAFLGLLGAVILTSSLVLSDLRQGQATPPPPAGNKDVLVINGAGQPVPTAAQGVTEVSGTVSIGNVPAVQVANGEAARTPFQHRFSLISVDPGDSLNSAVYFVPAGKRLVVEHVTMRMLDGGLPFGDLVTYVQLMTTPYVGVAEALAEGIPIPQTQIGSGAQTTGTTNIPLRLYVDAGGLLYVNAYGSVAGAGHMDVHVTVIGYLIDVP